MPIEEFTISNTSAIKFVEYKNIPKLMIIAGPTELANQHY